jgi:hemoglobin
MINHEMTFQEIENWLIKINQLFYEKVYQDSWLGLVFKNVPIEFITTQQVDFMLGSFGGPKRYSGRSPSDAHPHIFITEEMWDRRETILKSSFQELNAPLFIQEKWLRIDQAFKKSIILASPDLCTPRFGTDEIINIPNPFPNKKSA